jgi:hypothetical protein
LLDALDGLGHTGFKPLVGATAFQAECTFDGDVSEDHFEEHASFPFSTGSCTAASESAPSEYVFANIAETRAFSLKESVTLMLVQANLSSVVGLADWAVDGKAYLIKSVVGPTASSENWKAGRKVSRRAINLINYGSATSRSILSIRAIYSDATESTSYPPTCTKEHIKQNFIDEVGPNLYQASYETMTFDTVDVMDVDMGSLSSGTLVGCDYTNNLAPETERWAAKAIELIGAAKFNSYDHYEYWLPEAAECSWGGLGGVGWGTTWERLQLGCRPSYMTHVRMHEIGHNLGLRHATSISANLHSAIEYGDSTDELGQGYKVGFALPHSHTLKWVPDSVIASFKSVLNGATSAFIDIHSMRTNPSSLASGQYMGIALENSNANDHTDCYISYRSSSGLDGNLESAYENAISIHFGESEGYNYRTYFLTALKVGETYSIPDTFTGDSGISEGQQNLNWDAGVPAAHLLVHFCSSASAEVAKIALVASSSSSLSAQAAAAACAGTDQPPKPPPSSPAPPGAPCGDLKLEVVTQSYGEECSIKWDGAEVAAQGSMDSHTNTSFTLPCVAPGSHTMELIDSYGDGWHGGYVNVYLDDQFVAKYNGPASGALRGTCAYTYSFACT